MKHPIDDENHQLLMSCLTVNEQERVVALLEINDEHQMALKEAMSIAFCAGIHLVSDTLR